MKTRTFVPFPKIQAFHHVVKYARARAGRGLYTGDQSVEYRGSVKLHGTNAGVRVTPAGEVIPQSRTRELTLDADNYGFAGFVNERQQAIREIASHAQRIAQDIKLSGDVVLFGEWCGPGIQKGVAVAQLPKRQWVLFAAALVVGDTSTPWYVDLRGSAATSIQCTGIHCITQQPEHKLTVDMESPASCSAAVEIINAATQAVEAECPWGRAFGISGTGEGLVWTPVGEHAGRTDLWFKSKGNEHRGAPKSVKPASVTAEQHASIDAFVAAHVHEGRVKQGVDFVREQGKPIDMTSTGAFMAWLAADVQAEHADEAEGLAPKALQKAIGREALRAWREVVRLEPARG